MSATFTPGPWLNEPGSHQIFAMTLRNDGKKNTIARAAISTEGGSEVECANARLIAAAPELYEALIEVKKYMKRAPYSVFQKIDAALAKVQP